MIVVVSWLGLLFMWLIVGCLIDCLLFGLVSLGAMVCCDWVCVMDIL